MSALELVLVALCVWSFLFGVAYSAMSIIGMVDSE